MAKKRSNVKIWAQYGITPDGAPVADKIAKLLIESGVAVGVGQNLILAVASQVEFQVNRLDALYFKSESERKKFEEHHKLVF